jgi:hypothetical protein
LIHVHNSNNMKNKVIVLYELFHCGCALIQSSMTNIPEGQNEKILIVHEGPAISCTRGQVTRDFLNCKSMNVHMLIF